MAKWQKDVLLQEIFQLSEQITQLRFKVKSEQDAAKREMIQAKLNGLDRTRNNFKHILRVLYNSQPPVSPRSNETSTSTQTPSNSTSRTSQPLAKVERKQYLPLPHHNRPKQQSTTIVMQHHNSRVLAQPIPLRAVATSAWTPTLSIWILFFVVDFCYYLLRNSIETVEGSSS